MFRRHADTIEFLKLNIDDGLPFHFLFAFALSRGFHQFVGPFREFHSPSNELEISTVFQIHYGAYLRILHLM